jgi:hypothetical protein
MTSTSKGRGSDPRAALAEVKAHMFPDGSYYDRPDEFIGEADAEIAALAERGVLLVTALSDADKERIQKVKDAVASRTTIKINGQHYPDKEPTMLIRLSTVNFLLDRLAALSAEVDE